VTGAHNSTWATLPHHQPAKPRHRGAAVATGAIEITAGQLALPPVDDVLILHKMQMHEQAPTDVTFPTCAGKSDRFTAAVESGATVTSV
jgi:hypothetical protein